MPGVEVAGFEERGEERLVQAFHVSFLGLDGAVLHPGHEADELPSRCALLPPQGSSSDLRRGVCPGNSVLCRIPGQINPRR